MFLSSETRRESRSGRQREGEDSRKEWEMKKTGRNKRENTILEPTVSSILSLWASHLGNNKEMTMAFLFDSVQADTVGTARMCVASFKSPFLLEFWAPGSREDPEHGARRAGLLERLPQVRARVVRGVGAAMCWGEGGVPSARLTSIPTFSGYRRRSVRGQRDR